MLFRGSCFVSDLLFNSGKPFCSFSALCDLYAHSMFYMTLGVGVPEKCYILQRSHLTADFLFYLV